MRLSRRGLITGGLAVGGTMALSGCASTGAAPVQQVMLPAVDLAPRPIQTVQVRPPLDPTGQVRPELMSRAMAALDIHHRRIPSRDRMYLVDFTRFSGETRLYEVNLESGGVQAFRTSHGRGSDPAHSGYAQQFSNVMDSHMSSVGSFVTAGPNWGPQQGPNVLLDGLEYSNSAARERAIIVHGADYAEPEFLAREGKLGRSYGCFSLAHADLQAVRDRMGEGRLLFALA